jgi:NTE family protein
MKLGVALSGGGARGIAHLGVLKAFDEHNIRIDYLSGVSAGSIVGAFYSCGYKPDEIFTILVKTKLFRIIRPGLSRTGLLKLDRLESIFREYFPSNDFSALRIPLFVGATNFTTGKIEYFTEGELFKAVMASSCLPVIFNPVKIKDCIYVDGGLTENLPVSPLTGIADKIIAVHSNPTDDQFQSKSLKAFIERVFLIAISGNTKISRSMVDLYLEPDQLKHFSGSALSKAREIFDVGYNYTKENIANVLNLVSPEVSEKL